MDNNNRAVKVVRRVAMASASNVLLTVALLLLPLFILLIVFAGAIGGNFAEESKSGRYTPGGNIVCRESGFTIDKTSLSKSEFVDKVKDYANKTGMASVFSENAGNIYDKAVSKNINPELVVIRAVAESQGKKENGAYNYWGIGCTNTGGGKDCESFSSFMDGVERFLGIVSNYSSLSDMMSRYSFIGTYWYNPGNSDVGGCYYAPYIYPNGIPARVSTACTKVCSVGNTSACVATTEDDQKAYRDWQVKVNMASIRKSIFGLEYSEGVNCSGNNGNLVELTDYTLGHSGLSPVHSPLSEANIQSVNNYIKESVNKSGYGTGAGVAAAGQSLINGLRQLGYYLPYYWGGGHSDGAAIVGISSYLGTSGKSCSSSRCYYYHSFDCSGFVSWAIRNGCKADYRTVTTGTYISSKYGPSISIAEAKPGDIMVYRSGDHGHIRLVIKNNGDGSIITAESGGGETGVVFKKYSSLGAYTIRDMTAWYASNCDKSG